jgi:hypothetical protein
MKGHTMSTNHAKTIANAIDTLIRAEPLPSFRSPEHGAIVAAVTAVCNADPTTANKLRAEVGHRVVSLLIDQIKGSMQGERAIAMMRDQLRPLQ